MPTIAIALKHIVIDPQRPIDLTACAEHRGHPPHHKTPTASSAPSSTSPSSKGSPIITLPDEKAQRASDALKTFDRALRTAQRGDYKRAISQFHQVLAVLPGHADARRNLGMAYEEIGDVESAKDHIIEALKLNPQDAWSYVLLGNIYMKREKNYDRADKLYRRALEITPNDAMLLTNYGALMGKKGNTEQAEEFYERAIAADPKYPNSYFNLALLALNEGRPDQALATIDDLFARSESSRPALRAASTTRPAASTWPPTRRPPSRPPASSWTMSRPGERALEEQGGTPIRLVRDDSLSVSAVIADHLAAPPRPSPRPLPASSRRPSPRTSWRTSWSTWPSSWRRGKLVGTGCLLPLQTTVSLPPDPSATTPPGSSRRA